MQRSFIKLKIGVSIYFLSILRIYIFEKKIYSFSKSNYYFFNQKIHEQRKKYGPSE